MHLQFEGDTQQVMRDHGKVLVCAPNLAYLLDRVDAGGVLALT